MVNFQILEKSLETYQIPLSSRHDLIRRHARTPQKPWPNPPMARSRIRKKRKLHQQRIRSECSTPQTLRSPSTRPIRRHQSRRKPPPIPSKTRSTSRPHLPRSSTREIRTMGSGRHRRPPHYKTMGHPRAQPRRPGMAGRATPPVSIPGHRRTRHLPHRHHKKGVTPPEFLPFHPCLHCRQRLTR